MEPGRAIHRVELQYKAITRSTSGEETVAWTTSATVWAEIEPLQGREYYQAQQIQSEVSTRIKIWFRRGITPATWRAVYGTKSYEILSVINPGMRNAELHLMCKEVVGK